MRYLCAILFVLMVIRCQSPSSSDAGIRATSSARVIDWQGHRGARGLLPENTIPAFLKALEYPITTLELDVVISKDSQVIVSHEPWMSHEICNTPTGRAVKAEERSQFNLFEMTYEQIKGFDCGGRGNERFGEQQAIQTHKPSLLEAVTQVELYCQQKNITPPRYNIEIKSQPSHDNIFTPEPATFARLLLDDINALDIQSRTTIQSFDPRSLEAVHRQNASVQTAYLVYLPGVAEQMKLLSYTPEIYSPYYLLLNPATIDSIHQLNMKIIPWTINDVETMRRLIDAGVDGIITDYPNLIGQVQ